MATAPTDNVSAPQSASGGFSGVVDNLLKLFQGGSEVYKNITQKTGVSQSQNQSSTVVPGTVDPNRPIILGLNQNQLLLVAGGLTLVLLVSMARRR